MNHQAILKRAWHILFNYKTLWVFGFILALTTASMTGRGGGGSSGRGDGGHMNFNFGEASKVMPWLNDLNRNLNFTWDRASTDFTTATGASLAAVIAAVVIVALLLIVALTIAHYVSKVAMIKMVNDYEGTGEKMTWKQGFRLGWSRAAWRLFLINLLIFGAVLVAILLAGGCVALPILAAGGFQNNDPSIGAIVAGIGLLFLFIFAAILLAVTLSIVLEPIYRASVLEDLGVMDAFKRGWKLVRANLKDVLLMWLILLGIQIGFAILMIPIALIVIGIGLAIGGGSGLGIYLLSALSMSKNAAILPAAIVGGLLFLLILIIPLTFVEGLKETYVSTTWTLLYRELRMPLPTASEPRSDLPPAGAAS